MLNILLLITAYILNNPAVAEPLHGYLNEQGEQVTPITYATIPPTYGLEKTQRTKLQGHAIEDKELHGSLYLVNPSGLVIWRTTRHPETALLKRGDRILAIDSHAFSLILWHNLLTDITYHLTVKHKDKTIEDIPWFRMTDLEYEQNR
jgi:hypothetical protein